jgi:hypothetical protein
MRKLVLTAAALISATCLNAQSWQSLKTEALNAGGDFTKAPTTVLLDSTAVRINELGSGEFVIRKVVMVNSDAGAMDTRILKYDYDPLTAFAEFQDITIYRADGNVEAVDLSSTCDYTAYSKGIYWGARQIMFEIGRLAKGDVIDYTINKKGFTYALLMDGTVSSEDERFVPPMRGHFYDIVPFWVDAPTVKKVYQTDFPASKNLQYKFYQGECKVDDRTEGDRRICTFEVNMAKKFVAEPNMVDKWDVAPKLILTSTKEWKDKSVWFNGVNEDYGSFAEYEPAKKKVKQLLKGVDDDMRKIEILTHWVADNIRYSGIPMGKGEGYTLHNTKTNFDDRCGVCKDKAAMLISMLRMAGFEAYPAMTMAGSRIESLPADHFNHCVAVVRRPDGSLMPLDPTWVPFMRELWSSAEQQQNYLPGIPEGSDLMCTPVSAPENHYLKISSDAVIDENGTMKGTLVVSAEGQSDAVVRRPWTTGWRAMEHQNLENELLKISPKAKLISVDSENSKDYQTGPIKITMKFEIPDYAVVANNAIVCKPVVMSEIYSSVKSFLNIKLVDNRKYGFKDRCSRLVELNETITLPKGYAMTDGQIDEKYEGKAASCKVNISAQNEKVNISNTIRMEKRVYEAEDWTDVKSSIECYSKANNYLTFEKK